MKFQLLLFFVLSQFTALAQSGRPNVIFIFADDHDADAISAYNSSLIQTPGIDRLAHEGMRFTHHFASNAICAPARATVLTGKFSHRNGHKDNQTAFNTEQFIFPRQLGAAGYQTALIGKWHLQSLPTGFDHWEILPGQGTYFTPRFINMHNDTVAYPDGYATSLITEKTISWLNTRDKTKPFLLMMHHKAPHRQWWPEWKHAERFSRITIPEPNSLYADTAGKGKAYRDQRMAILDEMTLCVDLKIDPDYLKDIPHLKPTDRQERDYRILINSIPFEDRKRFLALYAARGEILKRLKPVGKDLLKWKYQWYMQDYLASVASVDESVSQLLRYLDSTGLSENTLVMYTSDQGFYLGENGWFDKRFMYDVSMQSPLLARWKGRIKPGSINRDLTQDIDFAATILSACGQPVPEEVQGISLLPAFAGKSIMRDRKSLYYHYYEFPFDHNVYPHLGIRTETHKLIYFYTIDEWELYDLKKDPAEQNNLYGDPSKSSLIARLKSELDELRLKYGDTAPAGGLTRK